MSDPGWITIPAVPTFEGLARNLSENLVKPTMAAGKKAAKAVDKSAEDMVASLERQAQASARKLKQLDAEYETSAQKKKKAALDLKAVTQEQIAAEEKYQDALAKGKSGAAELAKLERAKARVVDQNIKLRAAEDKVREAERRHEKQLKDLTSTSKKLKDAQADLAKESKKSENIFSGMKGSFGEMAEKASNMGGPLGDVSGLLTKFKLGPTAGVLAVAGAFGTASGAFLAFSEDLSKRQKNIQNTFGVSADAARDMQGEIADALGSGLGDYEQTSEAVLSIQQSLADNLEDMGGQSVTDLSDNFLAFTDTFGTEMSETVALVDNMLNSNLVDSAEEGLDLLTAGFQKVPAALQDEIVDATNEYGKHFSNMGLTGAQAMQMLVDASGQGRIAIDKVGDAVKEFSLRAVDPAVAKSLSEYGVVVDDMAGRVARGGPEAADALSEMADQLLGITDDGERAAAAITAFGTPLEDLAPDQIPKFLEGLKTGKEGMGDFAGASQKMADNTASTFSGMMAGVKGEIRGWSIDATLAINEWAGKVSQAFFKSDFFAGLTDGFSKAWDFIVSGLGWAKDEVLSRFSTIKDYLMGVWDDIQPSVKKFVDYLMGMWDDIQPKLELFASFLRDNFEETWDSLVGTLGVVFDVVGSLVKIIGGLLFDTLKAVWDFLSPVLVPLLKFLGKIVGVVLIGAFAILSETLKYSAKAIEVLFKAIQWLVDKAIAPAADWLGNLIAIIGEQLGAALQHAVEWIAEKWEWLSTILEATWSWIQEHVLDVAVAGFNLLWLFVKDYLEKVSHNWDILSQLLHTGWLWIDKNVFDPLKSGLSKVKDWFSTIVEGITKVWDKLRDAAASPVRFIIGTVWNDGILAAWNKIADFLPGIDPMQKIPLRFHTGGIMPGYSPGRDIHRFYSPTAGLLELSGGEPVLRPEVGKVLGREWVDGVNRAARTGGIGAVEHFLGADRGFDPDQERLKKAHGFDDFLPRQAFALGGTIDAMAAIVKGKYPNIVLSSSYRPGGPFHGTHQATDWATAGAFGNSSEQLALARDIATTYPNATELIYDSPGWRGNIKDGRNVGAFGEFYTMAQAGPHNHHVHWAMTTNPTMPLDGGVFMDGAPIGEGGTGGFTGWVEKKARQLWDKIVDPLKEQIPAPDTQFAQIPPAFLSMVADAAWSKLSGMFSPADNGGTDGAYTGPVGAGVEQWRPMVEKVLHDKGYSDALADTVLRRMNQESGGNPKAINNWDINAKNGVPSKGLMQVIDPTFQAHKDPGYENIWDPEANLRASINYAIGQYGSLPAAYNRAGGYADGGVIDLAKTLGAKLYDVGGIMPHGTLAYNASGEDEFVLKNSGMRSLGDIARALGELVPALKGQTSAVAKFADNAHNLVEKIANPESDEGIAARSGVRKFFDLGLDLPGSDVITSLLDGEEAIWNARQRQLVHLDDLAEKEKALKEAREKLAELKSSDLELSKKDQRKLADAEKTLAEAKADQAQADSEDKRARATEKVANAEEKLRRVREDLADTSEESVKKHAEEISKATKEVSKAEKDYAGARKAQVKDLDHLTLISQDTISSLIPMAQGAASQLTSMGVASGAVEAGLGGVMSGLSALAGAAGPAGITLGTAFEAVKVGINVIKKVVDFITEIVNRFYEAQNMAYETLADGWSIISEYAALNAEQHAHIAELQQALIRGLNEQRTAEFNLRVAINDRIITEAEGILAVSKARRDLDEEIEKGARAAQLKLMGLHEDWDTYLSYQAQVSTGVLDRWSDAAISALYTYESARAQALKAELQSKVDQIKAESALAAATRANLRNQEDLLTAQERLIKMSAKIAGIDFVEATATEQLTKLMVELQETQSNLDKNVFGRWGYNLGTHGAYSDPYRGDLKKKDSLLRSIEVITQESGINMSRGELDRVIQKMTDAAFWGTDPKAVLREYMPQVVAAEEALRNNSALEAINGARDKKTTLSRNVEDFTAEIELAEKVNPLERTIKGLDYTVKSLDESAKAFKKGNEKERGEHLAVAQKSDAAAKSLGVSWKLDPKYATQRVREQITKEVTIHLDGNDVYTADQVDKLLAEVTKETSVRVKTVKSASQVADSRRKELV